MVNNTDGADSCGSTKSLFGRTGGRTEKMDKESGVNDEWTDILNTWRFFFFSSGKGTGKGFINIFLF